MKRCSQLCNYDNSVFNSNPGLQDVLPEFLRNRFVEAALSYVACNSEGELLCRNNDCWCQCSVKFPDCNCPFTDIKAMEDSLRKSKEAWMASNNEFIESGRKMLIWIVTVAATVSSANNEAHNCDYYVGICDTDIVKGSNMQLEVLGQSQLLF